MRKTLFTLFAVLLVLSLATCDFFEPPSDGRGGFPNSPGNGMVRLTINVEGGSTSKSTGRALTSDLAQDQINGANYYEVVFFDGTNYHQVAWAKPATESPSINIPVGDYTGVARATLFAGYYDVSQNSGYKILLGIGEISEVDDIPLTSLPSNAAFIGPGTHTVTFTVKALRTAVSSTKANTKFEILGPTNPNSYATSAAGSIPTIVSDSDTFPKFPVPGAVHNNTGSAPPDFLNVTDNIIAQYTFTLPHSEVIILDSAGWRVTSSPFTPTPASEPDIPITTGIVTCTPDGGGSSLPLVAGDQYAFKFMIDVASDVTDGLCAVLLDVPVRALAPVGSTFIVGSPVTWHIRGGTDSTTPDNGTGRGALVILAVGMAP